MKTITYLFAAFVTAGMSASGANAQAAEITITGADGNQLMTALEDMGIVTTYDHNGGYLMLMAEVDCYMPVVPNPKAHCYVMESTQSAEIFDDGNLSTIVYSILKRNGGEYNDGSVGAVKVGLTQMSCYRSTYGRPNCTGQAKDAL